MTRDIFNPDYWRIRLEEAERKQIKHQALYITTLDSWQEIEEQHRTILKEHIQIDDSILDVGCAWGRLIELLPPDWSGRYLGVDISPDFIARAVSKYSNTYNVSFAVGDMRCLCVSTDIQPYRYDWCIALAVRDMIIGQVGKKQWQLIQNNLLRHHCKRLMLLTYNVNDEPEIITSNFT